MAFCTYIFFVNGRTRTDENDGKIVQIVDDIQKRMAFFLPKLFVPVLLYSHVLTHQQNSDFTTEIALHARHANITSNDGFLLHTTDTVPFPARRH